MFLNLTYQRDRICRDRCKINGHRNYLKPPCNDSPYDINDRKIIDSLRATMEAVACGFEILMLLLDLHTFYMQSRSNFLDLNLLICIFQGH
jgi:hypothetical protein